MGQRTAIEGRGPVAVLLSPHPAVVAAARRAGARTVVVAPGPSVPSDREGAERRVRTDWRDHHRLVGAVGRLEAVRDGRAAVFGFDAAGALAAARANEELGLPGTPAAAVTALMDKAALRARSNTLHAARPVSFARCGRASLIPFITTLIGYPCVIKPRAGSDGEGVRLVRDAAEGEAAARHYPAVTDLLVEEYLEGPELAVETLSRAGRHHILGWSRRLPAPATPLGPTPPPRPRLRPGPRLRLRLGPRLRSWPRPRRRSRRWLRLRPRVRLWLPPRPRRRPRVPSRPRFRIRGGGPGCRPGPGSASGQGTPVDLGAARGYEVPVALDHATAAAVRALVCGVLDLVGHRDGASHTEVVLTAHGPRLIEAHARPGPEELTQLLRLAHGTDVLGLALAAGLGLPARLRRPHATYAALRYVDFPPGTRVERTGPALAAARAVPGVVRVRLAVPPGATVRRAPTGSLHHAHVLATAPTAHSLTRVLDRAAALLGQPGGLTPDSRGIHVPPSPWRDGPH
ncbi:ATP-grasp domain-containing protein [Streptomyces sp. NPDC012746]|uniref:ATP-grasp domain-containing protein n=1 Tax=Streptomyces sp. NPDC012746 TaxID=3364845 RepID=UPI0036C769F3